MTNPTTRQEEHDAHIAALKKAVAASRELLANKNVAPPISIRCVREVYGDDPDKGLGWKPKRDYIIKAINNDRSKHG